MNTLSTFLFAVILGIYTGFAGVSEKGLTIPHSEGVHLQDPVVLPKGTILFLKSATDIYAQNFRAGDGTGSR